MGTYVGIDIAKKDFELATAIGSEVRSFENGPEGFKKAIIKDGRRDCSHAKAAEYSQYHAQGK